MKNRYEVLSHEAVIQGRCQKLILRLFDQKIKLWNINSLNDPRDQVQYFRTLQEKLHNNQTEGHTIVAGDFHLVLNTHIDKSGGIVNKKRGLDVLKEKMKDENLSEIWKLKNPQEWQVTST